MKKTIFEGIVNGEKFDNVVAYNARVKELMEAGTFVEASSNTRVEDVERQGFVSTCTCDCFGNCEADKPSIDADKEGLAALMDAINNLDEELSMFPFMEDNDPHYLDVLVTPGMPEINRLNKNEVSRVLEKCYKYIMGWADDMTLEEKKDYLADIKKVIDGIKADDAKNCAAIDLISNRRDAANNVLNDKLDELEAMQDAAFEEYNLACQKCDEDEDVLRSAQPFIDEFMNFYRELEAELVYQINEQQKDRKKCKRCNNDMAECKCNNNNKNDSEIYTSVKVKNPQTEVDFHALLDRIFENKLF